MEAARRTASERAFRKFALMTLRMDLDLLSQKHAKTLAETGQRVQITGQPSRTEKLLWAAALAPDDAEAQALFAKARDLAARDPAQRPEAATSTGNRSGRSSRPARTTSYGIRSGTAAPTARSGLQWVRRSASARRCSPVSGGPPRSAPGRRHPGCCPESCAGCPLWSWRSPAGRARPGLVPGRLVVPVSVSRCGADALARMN